FSGRSRTRLSWCAPGKKHQAQVASGERPRIDRARHELREPQQRPLLRPHSQQSPGAVLQSELLTSHSAVQSGYLASPSERRSRLRQDECDRTARLRPTSFSREVPLKKYYFFEGN